MELQRLAAEAAGKADAALEIEMDDAAIQDVVDFQDPGEGGPSDPAWSELAGERWVQGGER
eukprot:5641322-Alexandrium_andersonii.AAC.1